MKVYFFLGCDEKNKIYIYIYMYSVRKIFIMNIFFQGRSGEIKHLYRSFAFLMSRMMTENGGFFVCRTRHLVLAGGAKVRVLNTIPLR